MALNKIMLIGNAGKDADLRYTASGLAQGRFSLAVNNRKRGDSGEWEDNTEWFNITLFGDTAEKVSKFITKGKQVYVEGRLQTRSYEDQEGVKRTSIDVIANTVQLLGGREDNGEEKRDRDDWKDTPKRGQRKQEEPFEVPFE